MTKFEWASGIDLLDLRLFLSFCNIELKKSTQCWVTLYLVLCTCVLNSRTLALQKGPTPYTTIFVKDVSVCVRRVQQWWSAGPPPSFTGVRDRSKGGGRITIMAAIVVEHPAKLRSRPYSPLPTTFTEEERQGAYIVELSNTKTIQFLTNVSKYIHSELFFQYLIDYLLMIQKYSLSSCQFVRNCFDIGIWYVIDLGLFLGFLF